MAFHADETEASALTAEYVCYQLYGTDSAELGK
jgi:hypothetical protein